MYRFYTYKKIINKSRQEFYLYHTEKKTLEKTMLPMQGINHLKNSLKADPS